MNQQEKLVDSGIKLQEKEIKLFYVLLSRLLQHNKELIADVSQENERQSGEASVERTAPEQKKGRDKPLTEELEVSGEEFNQDLSARPPTKSRIKPEALQNEGEVQPEIQETDYPCCVTIAVV